jgi:nuclear transport factor 2 (NTF2) superfamily protein
MATCPPLPPVTRETVIQKVRLKTVGVPGILRKYPSLTQSTRDGEINASFHDYR